jgi:hypothetical protein
VYCVSVIWLTFGLFSVPKYVSLILVVIKYIKALKGKVAINISGNKRYWGGGLGSYPSNPLGSFPPLRVIESQE